jgi:hypothetical protein
MQINTVRWGKAIAFIAALILLIFPAAAIDINSSTALQYYGDGAPSDFEVNTSGFITANGNLDMQQNTLQDVGSIYFPTSIDINSGTDGIEIGNSAVSSNNDDVVIGNNAGGSGQAQNSVSIGASADPGSQKTNVIIGESASVFDSANTQNAIAIGGRSTVAREGVALGADTTIDARDAIAIGRGANATGQRAVAIGEDAVAPNPDEATFGNITGGEMDVNVTGNLTVHDSVVGADGTRIADLESTGVTLHQPLSVESSGAMSVVNGIDLTDGTSNTIDSSGTMYLSTSSGSATDIVLQPTGVVGLESNLDMGNNNITNCQYINGINCSDIGTGGSLSETLAEGNSAGSYNIDMSNQNIDDIASIDGGGDAIQVNDNLDMNSNLIIFSSDGVAIGDGSTSTGNSKAVAIGNHADASGNNSVVIGRGAESGSSDSVAIGGSAVAKDITGSGDGLVAIGEGANASETRGTAIGQLAEVTDNSGVAVGAQSVSDKLGVAVGRQAKANGNRSIALGVKANATVSNAVAIGNRAKAPNSYETTLGNLNGNEMDLNVTGSVTVHGSSGLDLQSGALTGVGSTQCANGEFIDGVGDCETPASSTDNQRLDEVLAEGTYTDGQDIYMNGSSTLRFNDVIMIGNTGTDTHAGSTTAIGHDAVAQDGYDIAIGENALASNGRGTGVTVTPNDALAIGHNAAATDNKAVAIGRQANTTGANAAGIGHQFNVSGVQSVGIGHRMATRDTGGTALGSYTRTEYLATAVGYGAEATANNSVAIGYSARAPNPSEATFGNLGNEKLDVNVTGNTTIHGSGNVDVVNGGVTVANGAGLKARDDNGDAQDLIKMRQGMNDVNFGTSTGSGISTFTFYSGGDKVIQMGDGYLKAEESELHIATNGNGGDSIAIRDLNAGTAEDDEIVEFNEGGSVKFQNTGSSGENIMRLNPDGNSDVAIPNGDLNVTGNVTVHGSGGLDMKSNQITNVQDPTENQDAATKSYVDSNAGGETEGLPATLEANNTANQTIAFGPDTNVEIGRNTATNNESLAIGKDAWANGSTYSGSWGNETAVGTGARATGLRSSAFGASAEATYRYAAAIGQNAQASDSYTTAIGTGAGATVEKATAIGRSADARSEGSTAIGNSAGTSSSSDYAVATGHSADASDNYAVATGPFAEASVDHAVATGSSARATSRHATAIGRRADASSNYATAIGRQADASSNYATAIGNSAGASGVVATAIGTGTEASAEEAIAVGDNPYALGLGSVALGSDIDDDNTGANASQEGAVAIGPEAVAPNSYEATFGNLNGEELDVNVTGNVTVHGSNGVVIGNPSETDGVLSVDGQIDLGGSIDANTNAIGSVSEIDAEVGGGTGDPSFKFTGDGDTGLYSDSADTVGLTAGSTSGVEVQNNGNVEVPNGNLTMSDNNIHDANTVQTNVLEDPESNVIEIADSPNMTGDHIRAVDDLNFNGGSNSASAIAIPQEAGSSLQVAYGKWGSGTIMRWNRDNTTDVVGGALDMNDNPIVFSSDGVAIGDGNTVSTRSDTTAVGKEAHATDVEALALGYRADAYGTRAISIGRTSNATDTDSIAIGHKTEANNPDSITIGWGSTATGNKAIALGPKAQATASNAVAIGDSATAPNADEATFGSLSNPLDVNVTGSATIRGGSLDMNENNVNNVGNSNIDMQYDNNDNRFEITSNGNEDICIGDC